MNQQLFYIIETTVFIIVLMLFFLNKISGMISLVSIVLLILFYYLSSNNTYVIKNNQWKTFAIFGAIITIVSFVINATNIYRINSSLDSQNLISYYKYWLEISKNIDSLFMQYPKQLGYLLNDIYGHIGKEKIQDYAETRDLDLEYLAAVKIIRGFESLTLRGINYYGVERLANREFQGMTSTLQAFLSSKLIKEYWTEIKPMINDLVVDIFDSLMMFGRFGSLKTYHSIGNE